MSKQNIKGVDDTFLDATAIKSKAIKISNILMIRYYIYTFKSIYLGQRCKITAIRCKCKPLFKVKSKQHRPFDKYS